MNSFKKIGTTLAKGSVFGMVFGLGAMLAVGATWSAPTAAPTGSNASAPIVSTGDQTKAGALILNAVKADNSYAATGLDVINGNVGIGIASPGAKLQVSSGDSSYALFGPNASWGGYLSVGSGNPSVASGKAEVVSTNGNLHIDAGTGQSVYIGYFTADNTYINPNGGYVGIGTGSASRPLEVNNAMKFTNSSSDPNDGVIGTATFAAGLNIVGINTDGGGRKINTWGSIIQNQNSVGNSFVGNTVISSLCMTSQAGVYDPSTGTGCRTTWARHATVNASIPTGAGSSIEATCSVGQVVISGGYAFTSTGASASASYPITTGQQGWECIRGTGATTVAGTCYAICEY